jgi:curved DNA-binding protein CbpA
MAPPRAPPPPSGGGNGDAPPSSLDFTPDDSFAPYAILGLEDRGADATPEEVRKAYRRAALAKHPDKVTGPADDDAARRAAAEAFSLVQRAYAVLSDAGARRALDAWLAARAARAARLSQQTGKRRQMREDLDRWEAEAAAARAAGGGGGGKQRPAAAVRSEAEVAAAEEAAARQRFARELEALRAKMAAEEQERARAAAVAAAGGAKRQAAAAATAAAATPAADETAEMLRRTLKVSWHPGVGEYTADDLRAALEPHGEVEDVVMRGTKKARGGGGGGGGGGAAAATASAKPARASALVVMGTLQSARAAAQSVCGRARDPLLVVPYLKVVGDGGGDDDGEAAAAAAAAAADEGKRAGTAAQEGARAAKAAKTAAAVEGRPAPATTHRPDVAAGVPPPARRPLFPAGAAAAAAAAAAEDADEPLAGLPCTTFPPGFRDVVIPAPGLEPSSAHAAPLPSSSVNVPALERAVMEKVRRLAAEHGVVGVGGGGGGL